MTQTYSVNTQKVASRYHLFGAEISQLLLKFNCVYLLQLYYYCLLLTAACYCYCFWDLDDLCFRFRPWLIFLRFWTFLFILPILFSQSSSALTFVSLFCCLLKFWFFSSGSFKANWLFIFLKLPFNSVILLFYLLWSPYCSSNEDFNWFELFITCRFCVISFILVGSGDCYRDERANWSEGAWIWLVSSKLFLIWFCCSFFIKRPLTLSLLSATTLRQS